MRLWILDLLVDDLRVHELLSLSLVLSWNCIDLLIRTGLAYLKLVKLLHLRETLVESLLSWFLHVVFHESVVCCGILLHHTLSVWLITLVQKLLDFHLSLLLIRVNLLVHFVYRYLLALLRVEVGAQLLLAHDLRDRVRLLPNLAELVLHRWLVRRALVLLHDELVDLRVHHVLLGQPHALHLRVDVRVRRTRLLALAVGPDQNLVLPHLLHVVRLLPLDSSQEQVLLRIALLLLVHQVLESRVVVVQNVLARLVH